MISSSHLGPSCLQNHIRKFCWEQTAPTKHAHSICSVTVCSHLLSSRCQNVPPHAFSSRALEVQCLLFVLSSFFFFHPQVATARCTMCVSANTARTRNMQFGKSQDTTEEGEKRREAEGEKERVWKKQACDRKVQAKEWVRGGRSCQQTREGVKKGEREKYRCSRWRNCSFIYLFSHKART